MPELKLSKEKMKERGYRLSTSLNKNVSVKKYSKKGLEIKIENDIIWVNKDSQLHDIDLDELIYLEEIYLK